MEEDPAGVQACVRDQFEGTKTDARQGAWNELGRRRSKASERRDGECGLTGMGWDWHRSKPCRLNPLRHRAVFLWGFGPPGVSPAPGSAWQTRAPPVASLLRVWSRDVISAAIDR